MPTMDTRRRRSKSAVEQGLRDAKVERTSSRARALVLLYVAAVHIALGLLAIRHLRLDFAANKASAQSFEREMNAELFLAREQGARWAQVSATAAWLLLLLIAVYLAFVFALDHAARATNISYVAIEFSGSAETFQRFLQRLRENPRALTAMALSCGLHLLGAGLYSAFTWSASQACLAAAHACHRKLGTFAVLYATISLYGSGAVLVIYASVHASLAWLLLSDSSHSAATSSITDAVARSVYVLIIVALIDIASFAVPALASLTCLSVLG